MTTPPPIDHNNYAIEYTQGPVFASNRVVGLGGAATSIAESVEGMYSSPAAPAVRDYTSHSWFGFELDIGLSLAGALSHTDYENRGNLGVTPGEKRYSDFLRANIGTTFTFGPFAIGGTVDVITTDLIAPTTIKNGLGMQITTGHFPMSYALLDKQLVFGVGLRVVNVALQTTRHTFILGQSFGERELFQTAATGGEFGFIVKPDNVRWRAAITARTEAASRVEAPGAQGSKDGVTRVSGLVTPDRLRLPAELEAGFSWQFGKRDLNPPFVDVDEAKREIEKRVGMAEIKRVSNKIEALKSVKPEDRAAVEREWDEHNELADEDDELWGATEKARLEQEKQARYDAPRQKVLLTTSLVVTAPSSANNVAISGFLDQSDQRVGRSVTVSPHVGTEFEPWQNRISVRAGGYLEPSRFAGVGMRGHGTTGFSVRLFDWTVFGIFPHASWQISTSVDLATRGYFDYGISLGTWD